MKILIEIGSLVTVLQRYKNLEKMYIGMFNFFPPSPFLIALKWVRGDYSCQAKLLPNNCVRTNMSPEFHAFICNVNKCLAHFRPQFKHVADLFLSLRNFLCIIRTIIENVTNLFKFSDFFIINSTLK